MGIRKMFIKSFRWEYNGNVVAGGSIVSEAEVVIGDGDVINDYTKYISLMTGGGWYNIFESNKPIFDKVKVYDDSIAGTEKEVVSSADELREAVKGSEFQMVYEFLLSLLDIPHTEVGQLPTSQIKRNTAPTDKL